MNHSRITIDGLEVFAHHGLLPEERETRPALPLRHQAVADGLPRPARSDDIADTVDYAAVCDRVVAVGDLEHL